MNFHVRPVRPSDLSQIHQIFEHYVLNTTATFYRNCPTLQTIEAKYDTATSKGLPYLVAVGQVPDPDPDHHHLNGDETTVLGYAYVVPFRAPLLSYSPSVEVSVFVHPAHLSQKVGTTLMETLLDRVRSATHHATEPGFEDRAVDVDVANVIAVVAHDVNDGPGEAVGRALIEWYGRFGFEVVGRLKGVGWKFGRWIDTVYLQLKIDHHSK